MSQHPLEQLNRYDAQANAAYYGRRPWLAIGRIFKIIYFAISFFLAFAWDTLLGNTTSQPRLAEQLRRTITALGPTYIKVGQALSTRPDLVRVDFLEELTKLQDQLPPFDNEQAFAIIEAELGKPVSAVYKYISDDPVAAASLGQVYRATLYSGEDVAVKVQRPHLIPTLTLDLYILRGIAAWLGPILPLNLGNSLEAIVDEFGLKLFEEINYAHEATNAERFAGYFRDDPYVKVPCIYRQFSSHRVLTLEWIDGIKLNELDKIREAGLDTDSLVRIGVMSGLRQLLEFGFFHADPHPGNLFATYDGKMAYIDFGMMDQLDLQTKEQLVDSVVHLLNKDYDELGQDYVRLGFLQPNIEMKPIVNALESVLGDIMSEKVKDFNFKVVTDRFSKVMYDYPFCLPAKFALIIRSVITQEGVALSLNPEFRIVQVAYPYVARRLLTDESESLRQRLLEVLFKDDKFQWSRLENLLAIAKSDGEFDLIPTASMGIKFLTSKDGEYIRRRILLALTEDNRLHTEEVMRIWNMLSVDMEPAKLWNMAVNALTGAVSGAVPKAIAAVLPFAAFQNLN
ncbi:AarF/ABC1/UbiB kinase family protein [Pseudanabaena sp. FACHB-1277]|uniref:AarF/ABC1/UbiB kinase family protein n=1 Tax=Pseudanabaena cinerea FACHB-1277 TaxID=2949581 RepID=A0A926Z615_9CYAN|nr:AarF/UbiB family protein [Pseudanabaena cinerea]MBD2150861.1 AarF/ABC1/UbiB kinase family protein [Pseudanabaena cinerea FACHB-1277]